MGITCAMCSVLVNGASFTVFGFGNVFGNVFGYGIGFGFGFGFGNGFGFRFVLICVNG